jgi:hypothetical protein
VGFFFPSPFVEERDCGGMKDGTGGKLKKRGQFQAPLDGVQVLLRSLSIPPPGLARCFHSLLFSLFTARRCKAASAFAFLALRAADM